ncbi:hypothetical protein, partial [Parvibaculum sp.]|uniref:hypothetical protein n=1 Tax=Parvibaculum sp. TaxID=2024848 RepID=UPI0038B2F4C0
SQNQKLEPARENLNRTAVDLIRQSSSREAASLFARTFLPLFKLAIHQEYHWMPRVKPGHDILCEE